MPATPKASGEANIPATTEDTDCSPLLAGDGRRSLVTSSLGGASGVALAPSGVTEEDSEPPPQAAREGRVRSSRTEARPGDNIRPRAPLGRPPWRSPQSPCSPDPTTDIRRPNCRFTSEIETRKTGKRKNWPTGIISWGRTEDGGRQGDLTLRGRMEVKAATGSCGSCLPGVEKIVDENLHQNDL